MTRLLKMHLVDEYMLPHRHSAFSYHVVPSGFVILLDLLVIVSGVSLFSFLSHSEPILSWVLGSDTSHRDFLTSALLEFMVALAKQHLALFSFLLTFSFIEKL